MAHNASAGLCIEDTCSLSSIDDDFCRFMKYDL